MLLIASYNLLVTLGARTTTDMASKVLYYNTSTSKQLVLVSLVARVLTISSTIRCTVPHLFQRINTRTVVPALLVRPMQLTTILARQTEDISDEGHFRLQYSIK